MKLRKQLRRPLTLIPLGALLVAGLAGLPSSPAVAASDLDVVPRVQSWTPGSGTLTLASGSRLVVDSADASLTSSGVSGPFSGQNTLLESVTAAAPALRSVSALALPVVTATAPAPGDLFFTLAADPARGTEGYTLTSTTTGATVSAPTSTGAFYGGNTISQLLNGSSDHKSLAVGTATDNPSLGYRAVSIDVARKFWTVEELKDEIRRLAWFKLNVLQLHFNEDEAFRLYSPNPSFSALAPTSSAARYSEAQIRDIVGYARSLDVTVVPEIDTPAHSKAIGTIDTTRTFAASCGDSGVMDITKASVRQWLSSLYAEFLPWFDGSPYFHIGNDEVPSSLNNCAYVQATGRSIDSWQIQFVNELNTTIKAGGMKTLMWANGSAILPDLDVSFVNFGSLANAANLRDLGYDVVDTAWQGGAYDRFFVIPGYVGSTKTPTPSTMYSWSTTAGTHNLGQQMAVWFDYSAGADSWYGVKLMASRQATLAERTWNTTPTTLSYTAFRSRYGKVGEAPGSLVRPTPATTNAAPSQHWTLDGQSSLPAGNWTVAPRGYSNDAGPQWATPARGFLSSASPEVAGISGKAVPLTAGSEQQINVGAGGDPRNWSVSAWVRRTADSTDTYLVDDWDSAIKLEQYQTSNRVGITAFGVHDYSFPYTVPLNTWTHLSVVSDKDAGTSTLYVNGLLNSTVAGNVPMPQGSLGGRRAFGGQLDDVSFFYQALTPAQVMADYNRIGNLALGRPVTASSVETSTLTAANAVDGSPTTRWSSLRSDPQSITVDLGATRSISAVTIAWEAAYASAYQVRVSDDGVNFTTISNRTGAGGTEAITGLSGSGRYLQILGTSRGTQYGYSIWELKVYGS